MTINTACTRFEKAIDDAILNCNIEMGRCSLRQMRHKVTNIREDNTMLDWYYPRLDGYIEALFFADILDDELYETMNDCMTLLSRATPA